MRFYINGRFLLQSVTGVQRVALEFLYSLDLLLELDEYSHLKPIIIIPKKGSIITSFKLKNIDLIRSGRMNGHLWEQLELPLLIGNEPLLCLGNMAPIMRLYYSNKKTITVVHDLSYKYFPDAYSRKFKLAYNLMLPKILKHCKDIITVSNSEKQQILKHYPLEFKNKELYYCQNGGLSDHKDIVVKKFEERQDYCLYVGSLSKRKNAKGVLESGIKLAREEGIGLIVIGSTGQALEKIGLKIPADLNDKIKFLGQINDKEKLFEYYQNAKFFLFPSFYEASPLPPIEAMSYGLPVVSSSIASMIERCGDAAEYCDAEDVDSIVDAVLRLKEKKKWEELQQKSLDQAQKYTWERQAKYILSKIC